MRRAYVTVYKETKAYGGSEEGGWWYDQREPVDGVYTLCCGITGSSAYTDEDGRTATDTWLLGNPSDHEATCPARGAGDRYHGQYVLGHTEEYLDSFTHHPDGGRWLDSIDDAPDPHRGEVATSGTYSVRIEEEPPQNYPSVRPHYE
jgi:hypothetical protein